MLQSLELFLLAAEELNFSKAAKRAYVTQQCLSDHIKRLETSYGVPLFYRKPQIALTPYGKVLQTSVQNIKLIETNLEHEFQAISGEERGEFSFGINATRARSLLPHIYPAFYARYPHIHVNIRLNETRMMEPQLLNGKLDMCLGIDAIIQPRLASRLICPNPLYCVLSARTLEETLQIDASDLPSYLQGGIDLASLQEIPFLLCLPESTTRTLIDRTLSQQNLYLKNTLAISDYSTHFDLCAHNRMATICPTAAVELAIQQNRLLSHKEQLVILPIKNIQDSLNVHLLYPKNLKFTGYMNYFVELLIQAITRQNLAAARYIELQFSK